MANTNSVRSALPSTKSATSSNFNCANVDSKPLWFSLFYSNTTNFKETLANSLENRLDNCLEKPNKTSLLDTTPEFDYTNYLMTYFKPKEDIDRFTYNYFDYPYDDEEDENSKEECYFIVEDNSVSTEYDYNEYNEDIDNSRSDTNSTKDSDNSDSEWAVV